MLRVPPNKRKIREITLLRLRSDGDGVVHGKYHGASAACEQARSANVHKDGYAGYSTGIHPRYALQRQLHADDVLRVVELDSDAKLRALRELLAGDFATERGRFWDLVFNYEDRLRPALRALARDRDITLEARELLALIAVPEDLRLIMQLDPPPEAPFAERWRYGVAAALVNPDTEDEWLFLRKCAFNEFDDHWVDAGAIQTLKLTASPRSQAILAEAQKRNSFQAVSIAKALEYVKSNPAAPMDQDLEKLASRVAQVIKIGAWLGNGKPRYNEAGDKALVDFHFHGGLDDLIYTATFHKIDGVWWLRGARETYQGFSP